MFSSNLITKEALMDFLNLNHGIIIEYNFTEKNNLDNIIKSTHDLPFIVGYKIGAEIVIKSGVEEVVKTIKNYTDLPIIYDHQKFGTDSPQICSGTILETIKSGGVDALIIFPQSGIETLKSTIKKCIEIDLIPIVGGDMVHEGYTSEENGYIESSSSQKMYVDGASFGAKHFIIPCTRFERMRIYCHRLGNIVNNPTLFIAGVGLEYCKDLLKACEIVKKYRSYAIIGKEISEDKDPRQASEKIWNEISASITN